MSEIDDLYDKEADELIAACLNLDKPKSFFLFAGAGSGKTRSLVKAIEKVRDTYSRRLAITRQKVGVITYTNAAADEIQRRLRHDARIDVSTIHAFAWALIAGHNDDIRAWLRTDLTRRLAELDDAIASTKSTATKIYQDRVRSSTSARRRLASLDDIRAFVYSPKSDNRTRDSLNHSEVIAITSAFLESKPTLQRLMVAKYPILLIDESQDTNRQLMDALLGVQAANSMSFCMGLLGDTMQRIYSGGKVGLGNDLDGWAFPVKRMNHRCPQRIIRLINRIRSDVDTNQQKGRSDKPEGFVRLFAVKSGAIDKQDVERRIAISMAETTGDAAWSSSSRAFKTLTLEHHMAAVRFGFAEMFEPLYKSDRLQTSVLDGSAPGLRFFSRQVLPAVNALVAKDGYGFAAIVRELSPMLAPDTLKAKGEDQLQQLASTKKAGDALASLFANGANPKFREVLISVAASGLFTVPDALIPFSKPDETFAEDPPDEDEEEIGPKEAEIEAWRTMLDTPFAQIAAYDQYVSGTSPFGTHQGVKGLEFPRVMVVISDEEARGFMFKYDKLFGLAAPTSSDIKNKAAGDDTGEDRTRRLFYVICSRAEESLAIVCYTQSPEFLTRNVVDRGWFEQSEVQVIA
jgi:DNA helicase II / ATP-dependent DNA helicase PcrA